jgi:hypothetical protein
LGGGKRKNDTLTKKRTPSPQRTTVSRTPCARHTRKLTFAHSCTRGVLRLGGVFDVCSPDVCFPSLSGGSIDAVKSKFSTQLDHETREPKPTLTRNSLAWLTQQEGLVPLVTMSRPGAKHSTGNPTDGAWDGVSGLGTDERVQVIPTIAEGDGVHETTGPSEDSCAHADQSSWSHSWSDADWLLTSGGTIRHQAEVCVFIFCHLPPPSLLDVHTNSRLACSVG